MVSMIDSVGGLSVNEYATPPIPYLIPSRVTATVTVSAMNGFLWL